MERERRAEPFADAFDEVMRGSGLTLVQLRTRLTERGAAVGMSTLSYWRSGARRPEGRRSVGVVAEIERVLGLDPGRLTSHLSTEQRALSERPLVDMPDHGPDFAAMLWRLGEVKPEDLTEISTHLVVTVDEVGDLRSFCYRTLWRADSDDVAYAPFVVDIDPVTQPPQLTEVVGCRAEGPVNDPGGTVHGFRLVFDRPLQKGDQAILEIRGEIPPGLSDRTVDHSMITGITELVIWVRFHPDRLPSRAEAWTFREGVARTREVRVDGHGIHARVSHEPAGQAGVRWHW